MEFLASTVTDKRGYRDFYIRMWVFLNDDFFTIPTRGLGILQTRAEDWKDIQAILVSRQGHVHLV